MPGRHPIEFSAEAYRPLRSMLLIFHTHISVHFPEHTYFFTHSPNPPTTLNATWLHAALAHVSVTPPAGFRYTPKSCRRGLASACFAIYVPRERINYIGGWAFDSPTALKTYADLTAPKCDDTRFFFDCWRHD